jgi:hypothetical protein
LPSNLEKWTILKSPLILKQRVKAEREVVRHPMRPSRRSLNLSALSILRAGSFLTFPEISHR